ncbi:group II intron reverse transcriptase/maturase [Acaryochloris marina]|uniref:RNA-directed DNA polymerase n=1 Tax=Acaryochloris marina (strain MBIC 11017) TaxID=329726 RepID=A8ZN56_ACAM1|nr:group II intron reverse transcriptase/maturase [Acaryochloris marina]ABW32255.1 RNA-directed DNA polymerase [Acaryochloris marina MBIC11017]
MAETGVERIASRARNHPEEPFTALMHHYSVENLRACFESLDGNKALGVDGVTKAEYQENLETNLQNLHLKLRQMSYRPQPVRQVEIPKEDGSMRPLGISCTEDKVVQEMTRRILEAIYEPVFIDTSYGFRPKRSCHDALRQLNREVMRKPVNWVADIDLAKFFDTMPHQEILSVLSIRIKDGNLLRLIARMLKAGIQTPGGVVYDELGSPQGSIVSPVIANIFLDYVLDQWFTNVVRHHCRGYCAIIRYADDVAAVFEHEEDAIRFMRVLPRRLEKYGLRLNTKKTHLLAFGKRNARRCFQTGQRPSTFDFLGLTHYWGRSRKGYVRMKRKTSKKRLRRSLKQLKMWLRKVRNIYKLPVIWRVVSLKLCGHFNYFGVTDNSQSLYYFRREVYKLLFKWLNRRSQRRSFSWGDFLHYEACYPLPRPRRLVSLY